MNWKRFLPGLILFCCAFSPAQEEPARLSVSQEVEQTDRAVVYYLDSKNFKLVPEERELLATTSESNKVKQVIEWLSIAPEESQILGLWPDTILLRDVFVVDNHTVVIDFYEDSLNSYSAGVVVEGMLIYSLVNSILDSFPWYSEVWVLLDGHVQETFLGHIDIEKPLSFNQSVLLNPKPETKETVGKKGEK